jgi:excisionase family DNA binding protein
LLKSVEKDGNGEMPPKSDSESLLTVEELAKILRLHPKTVYRLVEKGKLPCIRVGRNVRFSPDVIKQLSKGEG